ncbi:hypothetical protein EYF80_032436 [Liparis tanakae]|uniref:Uncharacterized protein n=1 Tax=Liparis tanakae TaxID=230148 RepID=A0A4Z2GVV8_9TELE|nr:hypothetical protein EYF80_032436 [Liparis tanakae]
MMRQSPVNTKRINTVGFQVLKADARSGTFLFSLPPARRPPARSETFFLPAPCSHIPHAACFLSRGIEPGCRLDGG